MSHPQEAGRQHPLVLQEHIYQVGIPCLASPAQRAHPQNANKDVQCFSFLEYASVGGLTLQQREYWFSCRLPQCLFSLISIKSIGLNRVSVIQTVTLWRCIPQMQAAMLLRHSLADQTLGQLLQLGTETVPRGDAISLSNKKVGGVLCHDSYDIWNLQTETASTCGQLRQHCMRT